MESFALDIRYALRTLRHRPAFAAAAIGTLALGIGANTAIFTVVNAVLLRPLPYPAAERLTLVWERMPQLSQIRVSYPDYLDWRERAHAFTGVAVFNPSRSFTLTGAGEPERVPGALVSANIFGVAGIAPALGRAPTAAEDAPGGDHVVLLSDALWRRRFAADPGVLGGNLTIDGRPSRIIGVMPQTFQFPPRAELWVPVGPLADASMMNRGNHPGLTALGRLRDGVTLADAQREMTAVASGLAAEYPATNRGVGAVVTSLTEITVGDIRQPLLTLLAAVASVLLIACANVANLSLARASGRRQELAVRAALGASRTRIARQLLVESAAVSLAGGGAGLALGVGMARALVALEPPGIPRLAEIRPDPAVFAFAAIVSLVTALLVGVAPAVRASGRSLLPALGAGGRPGRGSGGRLRAALVAAEVAVAMVLLSGATVMLESFRQLVAVDPGFVAEGALSARLALPPSRYPEPAVRTRFFVNLLDRLASQPSVRVAGAINPLPQSGEGWQVFAASDRTAAPDPRRAPLVEYSSISPGFFRAAGVRLVAGREFTAADDEHGMPVAIVNETLARQFWKGERAVGRRLKAGAINAGDPWLTVVGVVGDIRRGALQSPARPEVHRPFPQEPVMSMWIVARTTGSPALLARPLRETVAALDKDLPLFAVQPMTALLDRGHAQPRLTTILLALFGGLALLLAAVGTHAVVSVMVAERSQEMGIRMALGARPADVRAMVVWHGLRVVGLGLICGSGAALWTSRLLRTQVFQVNPTDPWLLGLAATLVAASALLACAMPAWKATRLDAVEVLRR
jgi:putative ABC transport system permease protein